MKTSCHDETINKNKNKRNMIYFPQIKDIIAYISITNIFYFLGILLVQGTYFIFLLILRDNPISLIITTGVYIMILYNMGNFIAVESKLTASFLYASACVLSYFFCYFSVPSVLRSEFNVNTCKNYYDYGELIKRVIDENYINWLILLFGPALV
eukprot:UN29978